MKRAFPMVLVAPWLAFVAFFAGVWAPSAHGFQLDAARERWERLAPAEQARLRERFEHLRSMPAHERANLEERARRLAESMRRVEERLSPDQRARLDGLAPDRRRALVRDLALLEVGERAWRVRASMPESWRDRLERASPDQRARLLAEYEHEQREHRREQVRTLLRKRFDLSPEEIARIDALPESERMLEIAELKREARGPGSERKGPSDAAIAARMQLLSAARARPSDHLRYAELPPGDRRELVGRIVRERVLAVAREHELFTLDEIQALEALSVEDFRRALRERLSMGGRGWHGSRGEKSQRR